MSDSDQNSADQEEVRHAYSWLGDHGQVSFEALKALAQEGTPEALSRLYALADDNNIPYDDTTDPMQLVEELNRVLEIDANTGVE